jgi:hypothetical protein
MISRRLLSGLSARLVFAAAVLCLAAGAFISPRTASAVPSGSFSMSPSNIYLNAGDTVAITFVLSGASEVNSVNIALAYDPGVVQVIDANAGQGGVQILPGPFPSGSGSELQNSVSGGTITYQYMLSGGAEDDGSGTVATAQFLALADGSADFAWVTTQLVDGEGVPVNAGGTVATLLVGSASPTPGVSDTPTNTPQPVATDTPIPAATTTPVATITGTATAVPPTATATRPATSTATAIAGTPTATQTAKVTIVATPNTGEPPRSGVDPSQSDRAGGLPSAGSAESGIAWWRWVFFIGALMFGIAGWFFTLAVYNGSKEVVILDRFDRRRRRR